MIARMNSEPSSVVSRPAALISSVCEILMPSMNSMVRTREVDSSSTTSGTWTPGNLAMPSARRLAW